jgi:antimicrobial peptide system SdpB family protein
MLDNRKNHWMKNENDSNHSLFNLIPLLFVQIIRLQMAVIYFHSSVGKFNVTEWGNGTAVYYWLNHSVFGMPLYLQHVINFFLSNNYIVLIITYGVIIFELILFLSLTMNFEKRKYLFRSFKNWAKKRRTMWM